MTESTSFPTTCQRRPPDQRSTLTRMNNSLESGHRSDAVCLNLVVFGPNWPLASEKENN